MRGWLCIGVLPALLAGCASAPAGPSTLAQASAEAQNLARDSETQRLAPRDVSRANESLARAERLAGYWGGGDEAQHYAYLSLRYADIARAHAQAAASLEQLATLDLQRQRLQLAQRESRLAAMQALDADLLALAQNRESRGTVLTLGDTLFDSGDAQLQPAATRSLVKLAHYLQLNPARRVRLEGYSDTAGSPADNLALSRQRAQAVAALLAGQGVAPERLEVLGYGAAHPLEANATERGRAANRRVEVVVSGRDGVLSPLRSD